MKKQKTKIETNEKEEMKMKMKNYRVICIFSSAEKLKRRGRDQEEHRKHPERDSLSFSHVPLQL